MDTVYRINTQPPAGRHAAASRPWHEPVGSLSVAAVCLIAGHPLPRPVPDEASGRHHEDMNALQFALAA